MPWTARKAASMYIEVENALSSDPRMNTEIAVMNSGLRP